MKSQNCKCILLLGSIIGFSASVATTVAAQTVAVAPDAADVRAVVDGAQSSFVQSSCFTGKNLFKCAVRGDTDPNVIDASKPASLTFTENFDGEDSYAVKLGVSALFDIQPLFNADRTSITTKALWQKNTETKKAQDNQAITIGLEFFNTDTDEKFVEAWTQGDGYYDFYAVTTGLDLGVNRKAVFGDPASAPCLANPGETVCGKQFQESIRTTLKSSIYSTHLDFADDDKGFVALITPTVGLFYDDALNDNFVAANGIVADGAVSGYTAGAVLVVTPKLADSRWQIKLNLQANQTFQRDAKRRPDFERSSRLGSLELAYSLMGPLGQTGDNKWIPQITLTYTDGSDSLKGQKSQNTLVLALSVKY